MPTQPTSSHAAAAGMATSGLELSAVLATTASGDSQEQSSDKASNKTVTVVKGTTTEYNPDSPEHNGKETEEITKNALSKRIHNNKTVTVLAGSATEYNPDNPEHAGKETEEIKASALKMRRYNNKIKKVTVLAGTATEYNPDDTEHAGKETEEIPIGTLNQRRHKANKKATEHQACTASAAPTEAPPPAITSAPPPAAPLTNEDHTPHYASLETTHNSLTEHVAKRRRIEPTHRGGL